jgi:hypothetical protein
MARHIIHETAIVRCPFSRITEMIERSLEHHREFSVSPMPGVRERVKVGWSIVDDLSDEARRHDAIALYWTPQHATFPAFAGMMTVRPHYRESYLRISGYYEPPLGVSGRLFDRMAGRRIARLTLRRLIRDLARDVESRYLVYLEEVGATRAHGHTGGKRDEVLRPH